MTTEKISTFRIVRRAWSKYVTVDTVETTWTAAMNIAMKMEAYNRDGEYLVRAAAAHLDLPDAEYYSGPGGNNACPVQRAFAYL